MSYKTYSRKQVLGIPIAAIPLSRIVSVISSEIEIAVKLGLKLPKRTFFYVNANCLTLAQTDNDYKKILQKATLVYSGGFGPVLASRILGRPLSERTPTPDFINEIFEIGEERKWSIYFLGSELASIKKSVEKVKKRFPKLVIAGYHHGYFDEGEEARLISEINRKKPDILIVGMGSPKQEKWIDENKNKINAKVFWSVGALFDIISGKMSRGPIFLQKMGLEWLYRLYQEPRRLWRRYTIGNLQFIYLVLLDKFAK